MLSEKLTNELFTIIDCMTGADGGVGYIKLKMSLEKWEKEDSVTGNQLLDIVSKFSRLIEAVNK